MNLSYTDIMSEKQKYSGFVEADAIITVKADSEEDAEQLLENLDTGHLGPPKVRQIEEG